MDYLSVLKVPSRGPVVLQTLLCKSERFLSEELRWWNENGCYRFERYAVRVQRDHAGSRGQSTALSFNNQLKIFTIEKLIFSSAKKPLRAYTG